MALALLSLVDAWLSSAHVYGIGRLEGAAARLVPLCFVLAGDLRYLLLVTATGPGGRFAPGARSIGVALALTLIVPLATQAALGLLPESWNTPRVMFLIYELAFLGLTLALLRWHPRLAPGSWLRALSCVVVAYYALWATADALILATGSDLGWGLRLLPNWLYYGGLIAALALLGPGAPPPAPRPVSSMGATIRDGSNRRPSGRSEGERRVGPVPEASGVGSAVG